MTLKPPRSIAIPRIADPVRSARERTGSVSVDDTRLLGNRGKTVTLANTGDSETIIDARLADDSIAQLITVTLFTDGNVAGQAVAEIEFGVDGFQSIATVDFARGASIPVPCSWVRVKAIMVVGGGINVRFGAAVALSSTPRTRPVINTVGFGTINALASTDFAIPPYASGIKVFTTTPGVDIYRLEIRQPAALAYAIEVAPNEKVDFTPPVLDTSVARVTNLGAAAMDVVVVASIEL